MSEEWSTTSNALRTSTAMKYSGARRSVASAIASVTARMAIVGDSFLVKPNCMYDCCRDDSIRASSMCSSSLARIGVIVIPL